MQNCTNSVMVFFVFIFVFVLVMLFSCFGSSKNIRMMRLSLSGRL